MHHSDVAYWWNLQSLHEMQKVEQIDLFAPAHDAFQLGVVSLIERAAPFNTCEYERAKIKAYGGKDAASVDRVAKTASR